MLREDSLFSGEKFRPMEEKRTHLFPVETFQAIAEKSVEYGTPENSWDGYALFLNYLNDSFKKVLTPTEILQSDVGDIDRILGENAESLAVLVLQLFPRGKFEEFASYAPVWQPGASQT